MADFTRPGSIIDVYGWNLNELLKDSRLFYHIMCCILIEMKRKVKRKIRLLTEKEKANEIIGWNWKSEKIRKKFE